jgi:hypothetical protein
MSDFSRLFLKADTQMKYKTGRNLAQFRQRYYQLSPSDQEAFKGKMQALADAAEWFDGACVPITVTLCLKQTWHSQDGEDSLDLAGNATPSEVLAAIALWDEADEDEKTWALG